MKVKEYSSVQVYKWGKVMCDGRRYL